MFVLSVIACQHATDENPIVGSLTEQKIGDVASTGIKIGETVYSKTSEVVVVPKGKKV